MHVLEDLHLPGFYSSTSALHREELFLLYTPQNLDPEVRDPQGSQVRKNKNCKQKQGVCDNSSNVGTLLPLSGEGCQKSRAAQQGTGLDAQVQEVITASPFLTSPYHVWVPPEAKKEQKSLSGSFISRSHYGPTQLSTPLPPT